MAQQQPASPFAAKGFLSDRLPWALAPQDGVTLTKDAVLLRTVIITPADLSFCEDTTLNTRLRILNGAFRHIADTGWSVYVAAHRSTDSTFVYRPQYGKTAPAITRALEERRALLAPFYTTSVYLTICRALAPQLSSLKTFRFREEDREKTGRETIRYYTAHFLSATDDFFSQLRSVFDRVAVASSDDQLTYFHGALAGTYHPVKTPDPAFYFDHYLADGTVVSEPSLKYNNDHVLTASVFDFPGESNTALLANLLSLDETFDIVTRFEFASPEAARHEIKSARDQHFKRRKGMKSMLEEAATKQDSGLEDTDAVALAADAGQALIQLANANTSYGHMTVTLVVRNPDFAEAHQTLDRLKKVANDQGFVVKTETLNNREAFFGTLPGNLNANPRKPMLSTRNLAHLFPISSPWSGDYTNPHIQSLTQFSGPHVLCKTGHAPFFLNLNVGDVGHTLVVGPTGAGKSTLLNLLAAFWLKADSARVVFFDKDRSALNPTRNAGGIHIEINDEQDTLKLNPFVHLTTKADQAFTTQLIADYLILKGIPVLPKDQQAIFDALGTLAPLDTGHAAWESFSSAVQDQNIRDGLSPFITGEYNRFFTRNDDPIAQNRWITFEMGPLMRRDKFIVQFVLTYLFYRVEQTFDGTPVLLILDEAWFFLDNDIFAAKMREWLKVLRKKNVYVVLATQEIADARGSTIFSTIVNSCFTKILLPNPQANQSENLALYRDIGLSDIHIYALANAIQKQDYLYFSEKGAQLFRFDLGPEELAFLRGPVAVKTQETSK